MKLQIPAEGEFPTYGDLHDQFGPHLPDLDLLSETPQDPVWHGEGDVEAHTKWVLEECRQTISESRIDDSLSVYLAAFFHDIGKVHRTRRSDEGRIISPGHAVLGRSMVARELIDVLDPTTWWRVQQLVGYHHKPARLIDREHEIRQARRLARLFSPRRMYALERADIRGREADNVEEGLEKLDLYRLLCEEAGVWSDRRWFEEWDEKIRSELSDFDDRTVDFVRAEGRFSSDAGEIHHVDEVLSRSYQYRDSYPHLIIMCGPSGSGKSTHVDRLEKDAVVSLDRIRAEIGDGPSDHSNEGRVKQTSKERLKRHLADEKTVVWDATNYRSDFRRPLIQLGYQYGAFVSIHTMCAARDECIERSDVADKYIDRQFDNWQFPEADECHEVVYYREGDPIVRCVGGSPTINQSTRT